MNLPTQYQWLLNEPGPKMITEALKLYGTKEMPGDADNPEILAWAKETGLDRVYSADEIPWCGLLMAVVAQRAGKTVPQNPLWAQNWAKFGEKTFHPGLGDVLVFKRPSGGHVSLYVGEDDQCFHCLGGNQSDAVTITRIDKSRCFAVRRPIYHNEPTNIRKIVLSATGAISKNES
jgi:uncharacterized protein (TIGR02594 family)